MRSSYTCDRHILCSVPAVLTLTRRTGLNLNLFQAEISKCAHFYQEKSGLARKEHVLTETCSRDADVGLTPTTHAAP